MAIDYRISKVIIRNFRGIDALDLELDAGVPSVLIGSNNAGKSTVLDAIALALNSGGFHKWSPDKSDFFCDASGERAHDFLVQVLFHSNDELGFPAVQGVGKPVLVHGIQVKGSLNSDDWASHKRTLLDPNGDTIALSHSTALSAADKPRFADHGVGYRKFYARIDDIRDHTPEVWLFKPKDVEAALYVWKQGPLKRLSKLLADRFLEANWTFHLGNRDHEMPTSIAKAHNFLSAAVQAFPFWATDMKPRLERIFERYVGRHTKIELRPDILSIEEWLAQQLQVSLANDEECAPTPLEDMGEGWQSVIRLAALEAVSEYPDLSKERTVLLVEEPETHLHPHLRRKMRKVLAALAAKGWTVVYTTHSSELVSFEEPQLINRLVRSKGHVRKSSVDTRQIENSAKLQSKLDESGAHDFLFGTAAVFCEGKDDAFVVRLALDKEQIDYDARAVSVTQCGSVTAMPAFSGIAASLGIRSCAVTDEDTLPDGTVNPKTAAARHKIAGLQMDGDILVEWPGDLERALGVSSGKATPEVSSEILADTSWAASHPGFAAAVAKISTWVTI